MKQIFMFILFIVLALNIYPQTPETFLDYIPQNPNRKIQINTNGVQKLPQPLTGNFHDLVISISFPDREFSYPRLYSDNLTYPLLGSFPDGTLLENYVHSHDEHSIPADEWYAPACNYFYTQQSGGVYNVNFTFPKTAAGNSYTTTHIRLF